MAKDKEVVVEPVVPQVKVADLLALLDRQRVARVEAANQLRIAKDALNTAQSRLGDEGEVQGEIDALLASLL